MGRVSKLIVKESVLELKDLLKREQHYKLKLRIKSLLYTKEKKFVTQKILSTYLGISYTTLKRWLQEYNEEGLESYLSIKVGGNRASVIPVEVHSALAARVTSSSNSFKGYWDVQMWIKDEFGLAIKYNTVRTYLIRHFKTKIKSPRKSHYKKNEQAIEAFLKTSR